MRARCGVFHRARIRREISISALMTTVPPNAIRNPAQGLSSNALPPSRPTKKAYEAQMTAATAVARTNRRRWYPMSPQVKVTAVRPPGMKRQTTMTCMPYLCSDRSAQARCRVPRLVEKNLRSANGPKRRPMR